MNFSEKHLHKSKSLLQLLSPMLENSSRSEFESLAGQFSNTEYDEDADDYLLDLVDYDFSNEVEALPQVKGLGVLDLIEDANTIEFREFPIEDGYVRVPVSYPGLTIRQMEPPDLRLWTAETAFTDQIVPQLYMFIPSALLGFVIGMTIWIINLVISRLYTSARKGFKSKIRKETPPVDLDLKLKMNAAGEEDLWKNISDAEKVNAVDGTMKRGDRVRGLLNSELGVGGGSDRKLRRPVPGHLLQVLSASEGKPKGLGRRRIYKILSSDFITTIKSLTTVFHRYFLTEMFPHLLCLLVFGLHSVGPSKVNPRDARPNILLLLTDDQDVELGSLEFMPKLHQHLSSQGATYSNGYVTTPMCCPSRSSMLTGLYVHNHHVFTNNENCSSTSWRQGHERRTFATYLQSSGYLTAYLGKYLNKYDGAHIPPGWSNWLGLIKNSRYYNYTLNNNGRMEHHKDDYHSDYLPDLITNRTLDLIQDMKDRSSPFMAVLGFPAPHGPEDAAPQYQDLFENVTTHHTPAYNLAPNPDKQWILRHTEEMLPVHKTFTDVLMRKRLQTLQSVDVAVERIVQALAATDQLDNTFIFYTSDHGYHLGQFGLLKGKAFPYDFDTHVPFFVRGPGVRANSLRDQPVLNIDLAPTFLDIAGLTPPPSMDGRSILDTLTTKPTKNVREAFLIERGKMSHKRYATVSTLGNEVEDAEPSGEVSEVSLTKRQKYLERKMEAECKKEKYQLPCLKDQNWVCRRDRGGSWKIKQCLARKPECSCQDRSAFLVRKVRSLTNPTEEEIAALGSVVLDLANQISHLNTRNPPSPTNGLAQQDSWFSSKSVIKTQIQQLRAQLNELKQIRKYLRMRRPVGVMWEEKGGSRPRSLVEETLSQLRRGCSCPQPRSRVTRSGDRKLRKLKRLLEKERRKSPEPTVQVNRKQDHCMADVKMNCFSHDENHWKSAPVWTGGSFCACTNSNNNTYWCVRNINSTHNYLYCEYVTGMITYSDLNQDRHQLRNLLYSLTDSDLSYLHAQLRDLKSFAGAGTGQKLSSKRRSSRRRNNNRKKNPKWRNW